MRKSFLGKAVLESPMTAEVGAPVAAEDKGLLLGWSRDHDHVTTQAQQTKELS
jgi:hypothetical protein